MNNANLYSSANSVQKRDAKYIMDNYFQNMKWLSNGGDLSLDIGCGDGGVTSELLLSNMPNTAEMIIATDLSEVMIQHASSTHKHPKLQFRQLDIATRCLSNHYIGKFDHIFSFYCLHWVQDQRQAFQNIYDLLKPKGDILVTYLARHSFMDIYEFLSKSDKWKSYMMDYKKYISHFHKSVHPEKELNEILTSIGFEVDFCKCETRTFVYEDLISCRNLIKSINPFIDRMPESNREEYIDDFMFEMKKLHLIIQTENKIKINTPYVLFVVYAKKNI